MPALQLAPCPPNHVVYSTLKPWLSPFGPDHITIQGEATHRRNSDSFEGSRAHAIFTQTRSSMPASSLGSAHLDSHVCPADDTQQVEGTHHLSLQPPTCVARQLTRVQHKRSTQCPNLQAGWLEGSSCCAGSHKLTRHSRLVVALGGIGGLHGGLDVHRGVHIRQLGHASGRGLAQEHVPAGGGHRAGALVSSQQQEDDDAQYSRCRLLGLA